MNLILFFITVFFIHWISDFVLQSDYVAKNKSENNTILIIHSLWYAMPIVIVYVLYLTLYNISQSPFNFLLVFLALSLSHALIDYNTSRWSKKAWNEQNRHKFFVIIGFDQFLHAAILLYLGFTLIGK